MQPVLSSQQIMGADDRHPERVTVPEWGGDVIIRALAGKERDQWELDNVSKKAGKQPDLSNLRARVVAFCLVDDKGQRLFSDADAATLGDKSAAVLDLLFDKCCKLNRILQAQEDLEKNSVPTGGGASPTG